MPFFVNSKVLVLDKDSIKRDSTFGDENKVEVLCETFNLSLKENENLVEILWIDDVLFVLSNKSLLYLQIDEDSDSLDIQRALELEDLESFAEISLNPDTHQLFCMKR